MSFIIHNYYKSTIKMMVYQIVKTYIQQGFTQVLIGQEES